MFRNIVGGGGGGGGTVIGGTNLFVTVLYVYSS